MNESRNETPAMSFVRYAGGIPLDSYAVWAAFGLGYPGLRAKAWPEVTVTGPRAEDVVATLESQYGPLERGVYWSDRTGDHLVYRLPVAAMDAAEKLAPSWGFSI